MCEPVSATTMFYAALATTVASTAVTYVGAQQQASDMRDYQNKMQADATTSANASFIAQASAANLKLQQDDAASENAKFTTNVNAAKAESTAKTAAGDAGVSGLSVDALVADFGRTNARYNDVVDQNSRNERTQLAADVKGFDATRQSRINAYTPQPVADPSFLGAALRIGSSGIDDYSRLIQPDANLRYLASRNWG